MDDLTFSARRASTAATAKPPEPAELDLRFRSLVQSPLRAGLLRYLSARPEEAFDVEGLLGPGAQVAQQASITFSNAAPPSAPRTSRRRSSASAK